ncbi:hypothetical protein AVEN_274838-1 [Araneus ventricosus]|uniref:Uncharacterized protein n=1 Tax=Araneus ventricosus TaxID=182803 RepID=A0A4Y2IAE9_ARAVE|nr:hypothetical protein AVEN_274838-1 [Araneus ventricosus]
MAESDDEDSSTLTQNPANKSRSEAVETMSKTEAEDFIKTAITIQADALKFIDGIPSRTFSKENRNSFRENMINFMSLVARQNAVLQLFMGSCTKKTSY